MSIPHRRNYNLPGHAHELTFSCYLGFPFLKSERACRWLAESLHEALCRHDYSLWAYVLMPEHAHVVVCPRQKAYRIEEFRKSVKEPVARHAIRWLEHHAVEWIPRITRTRGAKTERLFWQSGGGYDRNITESKTLLRMIDYIHLNPVRRGLVERAADWEWSSAAWHAEGKPSPIRVDAIPPEWLCQ
ncbi:protein of unknown function DUF1568 [Planctopirus limnophila DSM 3776]|uniref:Transposase IS200-like domain-containing protein n=1 Tax=Planctopirus limnophila (strain ATCC 43296 / DSM 3776 / IFAM 1008 / Mu 290) TaxID=521674 RepID=D5SQG9_PLAL2|nr:hypothetical protein [Planctopirus limnophila]ADG68431.1 protein of unknown function DUF1568 [Planctopirus limnophila DSM 3776]